MSNYYTRFTTFVAGTKAAAEDVEGEAAAIDAAFDLLPVVTSAIVKGTATFATESGAANAYAVVFNPVRTSYADGDEVVFVATNTNTGASTLKFDSLATVSIVDNGGTALGAGLITSGLMYVCRYDAAGARFILLTPTVSATASASAAAALASEVASAASETAAALSAVKAESAKISAAFMLTHFHL